MKKLLLITILYFLTLIANCQDTILIEKKINGKFSERFYVLKSDGKTKQGEYISYQVMTDSEYKEWITHDSGSLDSWIKEKGHYKLGKKDGHWIKYETAKRKPPFTSILIPESEGNYKEDKKVGIWSFYKPNAIERFDFDNNIPLKPLISFVTPEYPDSAMDSGIEGTVKVKYMLHSDCSITDIIIIQSLTPDCDRAVISAIIKTSELYKKYNYDCTEKADTMKYNFKMIK